MQRRTVDFAFVGVVLLGVLVSVNAPPEPIYGIDVDETEDWDESEVRSFANLTDPEQSEFRDALGGNAGDLYEPPALDHGAVRYQGTVYDVSIDVAESSVFSLLVPPAGIILAAIGVVGLVGRRLWRLRG